MTHITFEFLGFILFMLGMVTFAATRGMAALAMICSVSLVCATLLGQPKAALFGYSGHIGGLFVGIAVFGISLEFIACGSRVPCKMAGPMTLSLFFVLVSGLLLQNTGTLAAASATEIRVEFVRLCLAALLLPLFVYALRRRPTGRQLPRVLGLNCLIVILDALLLFPLAFHGSKTWHEISSEALVSVGLRLEVIVLSIPFLASFAWLQCRGVVLPPDRLAEMV